MSVCAKDIVFAPSKIGVYLAWQERIFRYICLPRVFVQRQNEQPSYTDEDTKGGQVGREFEETGIMSDSQQSSH